MNALQELKSQLLPVAEQEAFLASIRGKLGVEEYERVAAVFRLSGSVVATLEQSTQSNKRLLAMVFGAKTESGRNVGGGTPRERTTGRKGRRRGHGRTSQKRYTGARRIPVAHACLRPGQSCSECGCGKLRLLKQPATRVRLEAQPPVAAVIHEMERLRCDTCGRVVTAAAPAEAGSEKFDASVGVLVGLMRYGGGMPFHRLERLQRSVGVPLPASVQWEQAQQTAEALEPVVGHFEYLGAQRALFHNDDTTMRIAKVRQEIRAETDPMRTGIFTTGIVCEGSEGSEAPPIRLIFTGRKHAGENLGRVLEKRKSGMASPLHMCDALDRNEPADHPTELCHCLVHARRKFLEIRDDFPGECRRVVETFAVVYRVEAECRKEGVDPGERLRRHQTRSQPVMEALREEFTEAMAQKKVEPNSKLGDAIKYLLKRWESLTRFLKTPGAPLDNNVAERLLKSSILHRKNSMHYRTQHGADVGDRFMTVIETCRANDANPFEYMLAVVRNQEAARADPGSWMPWNYRERLVQTAPPRAP